MTITLHARARSAAQARRRHAHKPAPAAIAMPPIMPTMLGEWQSTTPEARLDMLFGDAAPVDAPTAPTTAPRTDNPADINAWRALGWSESQAAELVRTNAQMAPQLDALPIEPWHLPHTDHQPNDAQRPTAAARPAASKSAAPGIYTPHNALHAWGRVSHAVTPMATDTDLIGLMGSSAEAAILRKQRAAADLAAWRQQHGASRRKPSALPRPGDNTRRARMLAFGAGLSIAALVAVGAVARNLVGWAV